MHNNPLSKSDEDGHCTVDGENHGSVWCWFHDHNLFGVETAAERQADEVKEARDFINANGYDVIKVNGHWQPSSKSSSDIAWWWKSYNQEYSDAVNSGNSPGAVLGMLAGITPGDGGSRLTNSQSRDLAQWNGMEPVKDAPFDSHGQPVFQEDSKFFSPDADGHNGGVWKEFNPQVNVPEPTTTTSASRLANRMPFSIEFTGGPNFYPYENQGVPAAEGLLLLGEDVEGFIANLGEWSEATYRSQWRRSLTSLLNGESKGVLITTYSDPSIASHLEWWALYLIGEKVYVQNQLLFYDDLREPFSIDRPTDSLVDRQMSEGDVEVSEWVISLKDVRSFVEEKTGNVSFRGRLLWWACKDPWPGLWLRC